MANFTDEQIAEIERRISVHMGILSAQFGQFLASGQAQVEEARALLATHNAQLHRSSDRISALVEQVNTKEIELKKLTEDMGGFATQQNSTLSSPRSRPRATFRRPSSSSSRGRPRSTWSS